MSCRQDCLWLWPARASSAAESTQARKASRGRGSGWSRGRRRCEEEEKGARGRPPFFRGGRARATLPPCASLPFPWRCGQGRREKWRRKLGDVGKDWRTNLRCCCWPRSPPPTRPACPCPLLSRVVHACAVPARQPWCAAAAAAAAFALLLHCSMLLCCSLLLLRMLVDALVLRYSCCCSWPWPPWLSAHACWTMPTQSWHSHSTLGTAVPVAGPVN